MDSWRDPSSLANAYKQLAEFQKKSRRAHAMEAIVRALSDYTVQDHPELANDHELLEDLAYDAIVYLEYLGLPTKEG